MRDIVAVHQGRAGTTETELLAAYNAPGIIIPTLGWDCFSEECKAWEDEWEMQRNMIVDAVAANHLKAGGARIPGSSGLRAGENEPDEGDALLENNLKAQMADLQAETAALRASGLQEAATPVQPTDKPSDRENQLYKAVCRTVGGTLVGSVKNHEGKEQDAYACLICMCHETCPKGFGRVHDLKPGLFTMSSESTPCA
jgi:hypothetical protein